MGRYIEHPLLKPNLTEARIYQQVLAADVLKKGNTMIVAPTALGKTLIAILVAADSLDKLKGSKVLILAPSKPLAIQHEENFRHFLTVSCTSITGAVKVDERKKRWDESQIICATPQTVESDILNGRYSLSDVSLLVFDECHHAVGSYSYVYIAARYMNESKKSLILGLTASPGSDKDKIKHVCENLYIQEVVVKTEDDHDVKPYFNPIEIDWVKIEMGKELEKIREHINKALKHRLKMLKNLKVIPTIAVNKTDILKARGKVQNRIARATTPPQECYRAISLLSAVINVQHSLELLETQGITTLDQYFQRLKKKNTKAAKGLLLDADFSQAVFLTEQAKRHGLEHPKIRKLVEILKEELDIKDNNQKTLKNESDSGSNTKNKSKIIVFTQFRDTLELIHEKCEENGINSVRFFGQGKSGNKKGLTQKEQRQIIKSFKVGTYDVLISTSVAEEGIDIPAVDLVILYEPVPSEVRMIQRRGRTGRKTTGSMKVLITKGTRDEGYYWSSVNKEKKMKSQLKMKDSLMNLDVKPLTHVESEILPPSDEIEEDSGERLFKKLDLKNEKVIVYADSREGNSRVLRALDSLKVDVRIKALTVADYQVSDEVAIERKTAKDFVDSIVDKRLYKQANSLREEFKTPIMILEGDDFYSGFLNPDAIRGSIASIAVDFGISIIPTRNPEDTAAMIKRIAIRQQQDQKVNIQIRTEKKPVNLWEQQLFIVESLPNIGPVSAKKLLEKFGTIENLINASESELQEIDGIGKKIAINIKKVLTSKYLHFKDENSENEKLM
ncbi:DEAD/DEAH box helicase [Methanobrevibacter filiformis]|uniref:ATP-dependent RNA helicase DbpA n=1 Tax=Methanobrevibacter filiformis TaxID=55758 RepID=A0A166AYD7_9EURY|nr:DEAD/DEAH box helicase [Methanobrevibacter filiformis]KZX12629.1 ATP-dependent RNA helicase DbpA [Methanobrevibacter filiformis]